MFQVECIAYLTTVRESLIYSNFLILDDGNVYEARGFDYVGVAIAANYFDMSYDKIGVSVEFCGDTADHKSIKTFNNFLLKSIYKGDLVEDYKIFLADQFLSKVVSSQQLQIAAKSWNRFYDCEFNIYL